MGAGELTDTQVGLIWAAITLVCMAFSWFIYRTIRDRGDGDA